MVELGSVNATDVGSNPTVLSLYHLWIILLVLDPLAQCLRASTSVAHLIDLLSLVGQILVVHSQNCT